MLEEICQLAQNAGAVIMTYYQSGSHIKVSNKKDRSPVTDADLAAHQIIKQGLARLTPDIPLLSEEDPPAWNIRKEWQRYWLVDPLDGTKEFINNNDEFTVNIALIEGGQPVFGVVYAPVTEIMYFTAKNQAWKKEKKREHQPIYVRDVQPAVVVISRSHCDDELKDYLQQLGEHKTILVGSSLKFCMVAEGKAQLYPRFGPTNIWDTAAGHAVALAAGARIHDWEGKPLSYTPKESFLNPGFRVSLF